MITSGGLPGCRAEIADQRAGMHRWWSRWPLKPWANSAAGDKEEPGHLEVIYHRTPKQGD